MVLDPLNRLTGIVTLDDVARVAGAANDRRPRSPDGRASIRVYRCRRTAAAVGVRRRHRHPPRGPGALVVLPEPSATIFGTRARVPVRATFNGVAYRGSAMPMGDGARAWDYQGDTGAAGLEIGDTVHVVVERDGRSERLTFPTTCAAALDEAALSEPFAALAYTHRREYVGWVTAAKRAETRAKRVAKAVAMVRGRRGAVVSDAAQLATGGVGRPGAG